MYQHSGETMEKVTRIGVSLEPELLDGFDMLIDEMGYGSRSEAIRDLIREAIYKQAWKFEDEDVIGTITMVYNHHIGSVKERLMDIQHENHESISASVHVHLTQESCLEVLLVSGKAGTLRALSDELSSLKGVMSGRLTMTSTDTGHMHEHGLVR